MGTRRITKDASLRRPFLFASQLVEELCVALKTAPRSKVPGIANLLAAAEKLAAEIERRK